MTRAAQVARAIVRLAGLALASIALALPATSRASEPTAIDRDATPVAGADAAPGAQATPGADAGRRLVVLLAVPPEHFTPDGGYRGSYAGGAGRAARRRIATRLALERGLSVVDDWPMPLLGLDCYVMDVPGERAVEAVALELSADPRVAWAQPMHAFGARSGADPLYPTQPAARTWRLAELHRLSSGLHVSVAIVDSGVDARHPDLAGQVATQRNFIDDGPPRAERHGTAVAGIVAARAGNGIGIAGVAPGASLLALRACTQDASGATRCDTLGLAKALHFAIERSAAIINLSLAGPRDRLLAALIDVALARGTSVVAAVDPLARDGGFPASHPGVVAVAGDRTAPPRAGTLRAPGRDVPTTLPGGGWGLVSGTSFAAAHVSGLLALARELQASRPASPARIAIAVRPGGEVDACATLAALSGPCACDCPPAQATASPSR